MYVDVRHTHPHNQSAQSCYLSTAAFNDCYSELIMPYTALANCYEVSAYDALCTNAKATHINDNNYSCHRMAVELV